MSQIFPRVNQGNNPLHNATYNCKVHSLGVDTVLSKKERHIKNSEEKLGICFIPEFVAHPEFVAKGVTRGQQPLQEQLMRLGQSQEQVPPSFEGSL